MEMLRGRAGPPAELLTRVRVEVRPNYLAVKMVEQFGLAEPHFWPIGCTLQTIITFFASFFKIWIILSSETQDFRFLCQSYKNKIFALYLASHYRFIE